MAYDPAKAGLACPFCGASTRLDALPTEATEHALQEAIENVPHQGWGVERRSLKCQACGAVSELDPKIEATFCPFCGSPRVLPERDGDAHVIRPETLIPFRVGREKALDSFRQWMGSLWFRPDALKRSWALGKISGLYLPFWTFDAAAYSVWSAEAGHYYYVKQGNQQERRVRWEPASGELSTAYDDELVCASRGVSRSLLQPVEPFNTNGGLVPYRPDYLAGFVAERYAVGLKEGWEAARRAILEKARQACARQVPGDTQRNLRVNTHLSKVTFKHVLLPVWAAHYLYAGKTYHFFVNGESGKVSGEAPYSWLKIALAIGGAVVGFLVLNWLGLFG
jgi:DNA-directed RNA polymerase subunit RPC12/RpoP